MVAISNIIGLVVSQLALTAYAGGCKTFTHYCGHTLKNSRGWSDREIQAKVLLDKWNDDQIPKDDQIEQSLFKCAGQGESLVWVNGRTPCAGHCEDAGSGHSDYCA
ncbi:hypothetical protein EJ07DRAFT_155377 [Lizonia empirigonia]|nr:hypothetical protein EJ07DRAFT_155377 [Lizonia empirigonia]